MELRDHMIDARRAFDRDVRSEHQLEMSLGDNHPACPACNPEPEFQTNADPGDETEENFPLDLFGYDPDPDLIEED